MTPDEANRQNHPSAGASSRPGRGASRVALVAALAGVLLVAGVLAGKHLLYRRARDTRPADDAASDVPEPVGPGVYMADLSPSAAYVIDTSDGLVLVDTGLDADAERLIHLVSGWGLDLTRLRKILLTHVHGDHTQGAQRLRELTGAQVYVGQGDADVLRAGGPREAFFGQMEMAGYTLHPTDVDVALSGGETIEVGDARFRAIATPGHTPGSICYLMERRGQRVLFTGDVVQTLTGKLGTYTAYLAPRYRGDARAYLASLRRLRELPAPDVILVGHPRAEAIRNTRRLTPPQWREVLDRGIAEMQALTRRQADAR
jgi:glyoxylase-like metal-dependent hydrolase (beta-lactamase superfamily II)